MCCLMRLQRKSMKSNFVAHDDISIIGGGLVGYTAALAFAQAGLSVTVLEAKLPDLAQLHQSEGRAIALAYTSVLLYQSLGIWPALLKDATPIQNILISEQNSFGKCRINARDYHLDALGYVVPATHLFKVLYEAVQAQANIRIVAPFVVSNIDDQIKSTLILACDGTQSFAREYFHISTSDKDYQQQAIVANITLSEPHEGRAYQRFTEQGVLALLPLQGQRMTSVLTTPNEHIEELRLNDPECYLDILQTLLGKRIGLLGDLGKIFTYPLHWMQADQIMVGRTILLGNSAHTISPIAAQGLNIALRDLALLYDLVLENKVELYPELSKKAQQEVMNFTDKLTDFVKPQALSGLRSLGLFAVDHLSVLKTPLARSLMGFSNHGGSLMRGAKHDL